jgi:CBS domain-containing protein
MTTTPKAPTLAQMMTRPVHSILAGQSLRAAEKEMERLRCHHLPVHQGGEVVGVLTDSDVAFATRVYGDANRIKVEDACSRDPVSVDIETSLSVVLGVMLERRIDSVLVTDAEDGGTPVPIGIFTLRDAARALHGLLAENAA